MKTFNEKSVALYMYKGYYEDFEKEPISTENLTLALGWLYVKGMLSTETYRQIKPFLGAKRWMAQMHYTDGTALYMAGLKKENGSDSDRFNPREKRKELMDLILGDSILRNLTGATTVEELMMATYDVVIPYMYKKYIDTLTYFDGDYAICDEVVFYFSEYGKNGCSFFYDLVDDDGLRWFYFEGKRIARNMEGKCLVLGDYILSKYNKVSYWHYINFKNGEQGIIQNIEIITKQDDEIIARDTISGEISVLDKNLNISTMDDKTMRDKKRYNFDKEKAKIGYFDISDDGGLVTEMTGVDRGVCDGSSVEMIKTEVSYLGIVFYSLKDSQYVVSWPLRDENLYEEVKKRFGLENENVSFLADVNRFSNEGTQEFDTSMDDIYFRELMGETEEPFA